MNKRGFAPEVSITKTRIMMRVPTLGLIGKEEGFPRVALAAERTGDLRRVDWDAPTMALEADVVGGY